MIIAFTGKIGCGKTEAANYLVSKGFKKINFKDALVTEMKERLPDVLFEISKLYNMSYDELFKNKPPIMRRLMQNYGTEVRRKDSRDYWVERWHEQVSLSLFGIVTDDCRFINEFNKVRELGGKVYRINRPGTITDVHIAENEMDGVVTDGVIENTGTVEELYRKLDTII